MSNYIRSLLRFEKSRAAGSGSTDEAPLSERQARLRDEEAVRSLFEEDLRPDDDDAHRPSNRQRAMELDEAGFPMLEDIHMPGRRRRQSLWSRLPFFGRRKRRSGHLDGAAEDGFFSDHRAAADSSFGRLLDSLRSTDTRYSAPGIVLASTSSRRSVRAVIDGLTAQAHTMGVRLAVAELVFADSERVLRSREDSSTSLPTTSSLELTGSGSDQVLQDWFERATAGVDLLIIEGPPLARSVDAALMARAGDGLVIVAEPQATLLEEFETAIERAKASGCFVLGLVLHRHTHWLPRFLRGFFYNYPRTIRNRPGSRTDIERPR
jgi:hypothetical protein